MMQVRVLLEPMEIIEKLFTLSGQENLSEQDEKFILNSVQKVQDNVGLLLAILSYIKPRKTVTSFNEQVLKYMVQHAMWLETTLLNLHRKEKFSAFVTPILRTSIHFAKQINKVVRLADAEAKHPSLISPHPIGKVVH